MRYQAHYIELGPPVKSIGIRCANSDAEPRGYFIIALDSTTSTELTEDVAKTQVTSGFFGWKTNSPKRSNNFV